jgi:hypothetical protein
METTHLTTRQQILTTGILEDPIFMSWVMKNCKTFEDLLNLSGNEIEALILHQEQVVLIMAKCLFGAPEGLLRSLATSIPKQFAKIKDELSYLQDVTNGEKEASKYFLIKLTRQLQLQEKIQGFAWNLPPQDIFYPLTYPDGKSQIHFDSGILAAEGDMFKGKRSGNWVHNYDNGKILAEGEYLGGLKHGVWVFYYGNGSLKSQGKYKNDLKHGLWKEWDRAGQVSEIEYMEGVKAE